jgi:hypothetical protein
VQLNRLSLLDAEFSLLKGDLETALVIYQ